MGSGLGCDAIARPRGPGAPPGPPELAAPASTGPPWPGSSAPLDASLVHATFPMVGSAPAEQLQTRSAHRRPMRSKALPRFDQSDVTQKYCAREVALLSRDFVIHKRPQGSIFNSTRRQIRTTSSAEISVLASLTCRYSPPAMAKSAGKKVQMHFCVAAV